jgi:hypothetical protein
LIDIPPEVQIESTIRPGSVFYFIENTFTTSEEPHYFIVINHNPTTDRVVLLVCTSSQIQAVKRRRRNLPDTTVEIKKEKYPDFKKDSIVDCNDVFVKSMDTLILKLKQNELKLKMEIDITLVKKLRTAVKQSPIVEREIKKLISSSD